jgi:hypothetical protein
MAYYLLPISDREPLWWILSESRTAFPAHRRKESAALEIGDTLLLYTTRGCFRNPTRDRGRVIGVAKVASPAADLDEPVRFGNREFPIGVQLAIGPLAPRGEGVELAALVDRLRETFPKPRSWSASLRRALVPVPPRDARLVIQELVAARPGSAGLASYRPKTAGTSDLVDPDPLFFALEVFTQIIGSLGGAVSVYRSAVGMGRERRANRAEIVSHLHAADRELASIDRVYRALISIFEEADVLGDEFAPGTPLVIPGRLARDLDQLRRDVFRAGTALNRELTGVSAHLSSQESDAAVSLSHEVHAVFRDARHAPTLAEFLAETGRAIQLASDFVARVGEGVGFTPVSVRTELLNEAIHRLRSSSSGP